MSFHLSPRSIARLDGVHPDLTRVVHKAIELAKQDFVVVEGLRSIERQRELFLAGKSRTMKSRHITGHAVDLAPLVDLDGDGDTELSWERSHFYPICDAMWAAGAACGVTLRWGGDWQTFVDAPHWELDRDLYP